jgi:L-rhamnose isomerase
LVTEIEIKQTMAILEGAVSIEVIVSLVSEIENIYSGTLVVDLKALTPTRTEATLLRANQMRGATRYRVILRAAASYLK